MKSLFLISAVLWFSNVYAATVDSFQCRIELRDLVTNQITTQRGEFDVVRRPVSKSHSPDLKMSHGTTTHGAVLENQRHDLGAGFSLSYTHATRESGAQIEAVQRICFLPTESYCPKTEDPNATCWTSASACSYEEKPFDHPDLFTPTPVVNGVPLFDQRRLSEIKGEIRSDNSIVAEYSISCIHSGTQD